MFSSSDSHAQDDKILQFEEAAPSVSTNTPSSVSTEKWCDVAYAKSEEENNTFDYAPSVSSNPLEDKPESDDDSDSDGLTADSDSDVLVTKDSPNPPIPSDNTISTSMPSSPAISVITSKDDDINQKNLAFQDWLQVNP